MIFKDEIVRDEAFCVLYTISLLGSGILLLVLHVPFWLVCIISIPLGSVLFYVLWIAGALFLNWVTRGKYFENAPSWRLENVIVPGLIIYIGFLCLYPVFLKARAKAEWKKEQVRKAQARIQVPKSTPPAAERGTQEH